MGIFDIVKKTVGTVVKLANPISASKLIVGTATSAINKVLGTNIKPQEPPKKLEKVQKAINTVEKAITVAQIGTVAVTSGAASVALAHPIAAGVAAVGGTIGYNVLNASPKAAEKIEEGIKALPGGLANVGTNIGEFIENPSLEKAKDILKENPVIVGGLTALGIAAVGKGVLGIGSTIANTLAVRENTAVAAAAGQSVLSSNNVQGAATTFPTAQGGATSLPTDKSIPTTAETTTISTGTRRRRYTKRKETPSINIKIDDRDIYQNFPRRKVYKGGRC